jgi:hypothetical protein
MEQSSLSEVDSSLRWDIQEIPLFYESRRLIDFRVHKSPSLVSVLNQMNQLHTYPPCFPNIRFKISFHLLQGVLSDLFH